MLQLAVPIVVIRFQKMSAMEMTLARMCLQRQKETFGT
jgi:hypothetical protein